MVMWNSHVGGVSEGSECSRTSIMMVREMINENRIALGHILKASRVLMSRSASTTSPTRDIVTSSAVAEASFLASPTAASCSAETCESIAEGAEEKTDAVKRNQSLEIRNAFNSLSVFFIKLVVRFCQSDSSPFHPELRRPGAGIKVRVTCPPKSYLFGLTNHLQ